MLAMEVTLLVVGLVGHAALWIALINRVHARALPRWLIGLVTLASFAILGGLPLLVAFGRWTSRGNPSTAAWWTALWIYVAVVTLVAVAQWLARWRYGQCDGRGRPLLSNHTTTVDVFQRLGHRPAGPGLAAFFARLPGNELFDVHVHHKRVSLPRLPAGLHGLRIAQISDLHMSGRLTLPFFEEVVRITNDLDADLIAATGDLFDQQACFDWIGSTYARLAAPHGVYFVFGNHDQRVDTRLAADLLQQAGLVHIGGRCERLTVKGSPLLVAGNELPWFGPPPDLADCPESAGSERPLRVLLSHSPDQFQWAQAHDFDLVLAGHNHGGQIRFPFIGAVFAPSRYGTRYDMGTFCQGRTAMHVSRGTGTHSPVRFNCPPEITLLELRGGQM